MEERRKLSRIDLNLPVQWESTSGIHEGTVINCSVEGCFVKTQVEEPGVEPMKIAIQLPNENIQLWGRVAYYLPTLGFGLQFVTRSTDQPTLNKWLDYLRNSSHEPLATS